VAGAAPLPGLRAFFGLPDWPLGGAALDLGGRTVDVLPGPGHAAAVFHDRRTGLLFTGRTLYPGHLYVRDLAACTATVDRLPAFCERHPVTRLLGCHIEMATTPGEDYPRGTTHQPDEPPLQLDTGQLRAPREAPARIGGRPGSHRFRPLRGARLRLKRRSPHRPCRPVRPCLPPAQSHHVRSTHP
jgi:hydroxyacylglutathione hydrolase